MGKNPGAYSKKEEMEAVAAGGDVQRDDSGVPPASPTDMPAGWVRVGVRRKRRVVWDARGVRGDRLSCMMCDQPHGG